ncbi:MAG: ATP-binding cassette domain-containing protein [Dehalococcoidia bacterium]|jgi:general nucleoside transport system ATP-binding protein|nr:ATP-binding cassette domain-containing protein [Dehalococcoidia bacterium]
MKIQIKNLSKSFGNLKANKNINLSLDSGIHALLGENGAGKSTFVKIISGQLTPDSGEIIINGENINLGSAKDSIKNGIGLLNQDPLDFSNLSILESFLVGINEKKPFRKIENIKQKILGLFKNYGIEIELSSKTNSLSIGERQQIELIRLLYNGAKLIILDEPTSAFSLEQKKRVFETLKKLSNEGIIIIFVSHKLDEIFEICETGSILKSGELIENITKPFNSKKILSTMFENTEFHKSEQKYTERVNKFSIIISKSDLFNDYKSDLVHEYTFGSVIGIAGLQGSSNDKLIKNFFSNEFSKTRIIKQFGDPLKIENYYYMPADRLERGLFKDLNLLEHYALSISAKKTFLDWKIIKQTAIDKINKFNIKSNLNNSLSELSGGNQQRVMLSLMPDLESVLLLEQPTRGLDYNSANKIWEMILERKKQDIAILFSSTDIDEIWEYSDIIFSVSGNKIMDISYKNNLTKEKIIKFVSGLV